MNTNLLQRVLALALLLQFFPFTLAQSPQEGVTQNSASVTTNPCELLSTSENADVWSCREGHSHHTQHQIMAPGKFDLSESAALELTNDLLDPSYFPVQK